MYDVFISYSREDRKRIVRLVDALVEQRGWSIWFDEALHAGEEFPQIIQKTLEQVRSVVVVWSTHAVGSRWVIAEASEGWNRGILVPLRLDDSEQPLPFRQTEATDFTDWNGSAIAPQVLKLIEAIDRTLLSGPRPDESELLAREGRRRVRRRRKLIHRSIAAAAAIALASAGLFGWQQLERRAAAEQLAERAAQLHAEVVELNEGERTRTWGSVLLGSEERLDKLELATLLAAEAVRRAQTDRTQDVLDRLLAMSPWSDHLLELEDEIHVLRFNGDGTLLVGGGGEGDTLVWNLTSNATTRIPHGGTGGARTWEDKRGRLAWRGGPTIDIETSGARVATAGPDETAAVWDASSGRELFRLQHETTVTALTFVPRTDKLATVSEGGVVRVWDLGSRRELRRIEHGGTSYWIAASNSGRYLVSTSGRAARVWDAGTGEQLATLEHTGPVSAAHFSMDDTKVVTFGSDIETTIWDLPSGNVRKRIPVNADKAVFGPDGNMLVIGSTDGLLRWWSLDEDEEQFSVPVGQYVDDVASSADYKRFVTAGDDVASTWDFASRRQLRQMPYPMFFRAVAISADGRLMASAGSDFSRFILEVTEVRPDNPIETACRKVKRNLTRNEWGTYFGMAEPYELTCPQIPAADANK